MEVPRLFLSGVTLRFHPHAGRGGTPRHTGTARSAWVTEGITHGLTGGLRQTRRARQNQACVSRALGTRPARHGCTSEPGRPTPLSWPRSPAVLRDRGHVFTLSEARPGAMGPAGPSPETTTPPRGWRRARPLMSPQMPTSSSASLAWRGGPQSDQKHHGFKNALGLHKAAGVCAGPVTTGHRWGRAKTSRSFRCRSGLDAEPEVYGVAT